MKGVIFPSNNHYISTYSMDNMEWGRTQLLLFTIVQCEGAINYYNEAGNTGDYGSSYQYIHLDRQNFSEKKKGSRN